MKRFEYLRRGAAFPIYAFITAAILATLPVVAAAEDDYVEAIAPGYDIVVGEGVTFSWRDNVTRVQRSFELRTSEEYVTENSSAQEHSLSPYHFGSASWSVAIYNCENTNCWIGTTSTQNFYHYNNLSNSKNYRLEPFESRRGFRSPRTLADYTVFFELTKDYTIDIARYFTDLAALPDPIDWDTQYEKTEQHRQDLYDHARSLSSIESDFLKLDGGVLTLKQGFRWDGTSNPGVGEEETSDLRSSCIHDALYDLMRMEYLPRDGENHFNWEWNEDGYMNRLMADTMHFLLAVEDQDKSVARARSDWRTLRKLGRANTRYDYLLRAFKFHASELTAWVSDDGKVDLHWFPANQTDDTSKKDDDPKNYRNEPHNYEIYRTTRNSSEWCPLGSVELSTADTDGHTPEKTYYNDPDDNDSTDDGCDRSLTPGQIYYYWIRANDPDADGDGWTDQEEADYVGQPYNKRHYDESFVEAVTPVIGAGNALQLNGNGQHVISTKEPGNSTHTTWTFEAWVYPEEASGPSTILALSGIDPIYSGSYMPLTYDSENRQFCYSDSFVKKCNEWSSIDPGDWYHLAVVIDEEEGWLYVDGELELEGPFETSFPSGPETTPTFGIGTSFEITKKWDEKAGDDSAGAWVYEIETTGNFKGRIDELRVWNVARSRREIREGMYSALRGDDSNLVALWHFDEPDRTHTAFDGTMNGRDGEVYECTEPNGSCFVPSEAMNMPPVALCADVTVPTEPGTCHANASIDNGSHDPDGDSVSLVQAPPGPYGLGDTDVTLTATDVLGDASSCMATVTVVDQTPPTAMCNAPGVIVPPDAPISFTASATDNCGVSSVEITDHEFYKVTKKGRRIDKTEGSMANLEGDTVTIFDSGGVDTQIAWTVRVTDSSENPTEKTCELRVTNPGKARTR